MINVLNSGGYIVYCDTCSVDVTMPNRDWSEMIEELKNLDWKIKKENSEWIHKCPGCSADSGFGAYVS